MKFYVYNRWMRFVILFLLIFLGITPAYSFLEKDYQNVWCGINNGKTEVMLPDKARVDCVTQTHAVEFDFAKKWGESIGQSLYYASVLNKSPGVVLIMENPDKDSRYLKRLETVAQKYGITIWTITPDCFTKNYLFDGAVGAGSDFASVSSSFK